MSYITVFSRLIKDITAIQRSPRTVPTVAQSYSMNTETEDHNFMLTKVNNDDQIQSTRWTKAIEAWPYVPSTKGLIQSSL